MQMSSSFFCQKWNTTLPNCRCLTITCCPNRWRSYCKSTPRLSFDFWIIQNENQHCQLVLEWKRWIELNFCKTITQPKRNLAVSGKILCQTMIRKENCENCRKNDSASEVDKKSFLSLVSLDEEAIGHHLLSVWQCIAVSTVWDSFWAISHNEPHLRQ